MILDVRDAVDEGSETMFCPSAWPPVSSAGSLRPLNSRGTIPVFPGPIRREVSYTTHGTADDKAGGALSLWCAQVDPSDLRKNKPRTILAVMYPASNSGRSPPAHRCCGLRLMFSPIQAMSAVGLCPSGHAVGSGGHNHARRSPIENQLMIH